MDANSPTPSGSATPEDALARQEQPGAGASPPSPDSGAAKPSRPPEIGGPPGPEPTRYGDWQFNGRVTDF